MAGEDTVSYMELVKAGEGLLVPIIPLMNKLRKKHIRIIPDDYRKMYTLDELCLAVALFARSQIGVADEVVVKQGAGYVELDSNHRALMVRFDELVRTLREINRDISAVNAESVHYRTVLNELLNVQSKLFHYKEVMNFLAYEGSDAVLEDKD